MTSRIASASLAALVIAAVSSYQIPASFAQNVTTGLPPPRPITVTTDKAVYTSNDTITISGKVNQLHTTIDSVSLEIFDPQGRKIITGETVLSRDGIYRQDVNFLNMLGVTGEYKVIASNGEYNSVALFMFIAHPYILTIDGKSYSINYTIESGLLTNATVDVQEKSLIFHVVNSTKESSFVVDLPREVIDSQNDSGDAPFMVFINDRQTEIKETASSSDSRALEVSLPYDGQTNPSGNWDVKIIGTSVVPEFGPAILARHVEGSDRIITGMVVDKEIYSESVWVYAYETLKRGSESNPRWTIVNVEVLPTGEREVDLKVGEEVLLMLEELDIEGGYFTLYHPPSERPMKFPVTLKDEVLALVGHFEPASFQDCTAMDFEGDEFVYCTYDDDSLRFYVPPSFTLEKLKQEMLTYISQDYYDEHFDLVNVHDVAGANGAAMPAAQGIVYQFELGEYKFEYRAEASVKSDQNIYLEYPPPREISDLTVSPAKLDDIIYTCLDKGTYYIVTNRAVINHTEYGFSPYISGEGPPRVRDRADEVLQEVEKRFAVWPETGMIDCFERDERALVPRDNKEVFLLDASQYIADEPIVEENEDGIWMPVAVMAASSAGVVAVVWYLMGRRK